MHGPLVLTDGQRCTEHLAIALPPVGDLESNPISVWVCRDLYVQTLMYNG